MVALLSDDACLHQVVDKGGRTLVLLQLLLVLLQLVLGILELLLLLSKLSLHFVQPGHLRSDGVLLLQVGLLGVCDLCLRQSPLRAHLKHMDTCAIEH